jgi:hypothetical protein
MLLRTRVGVGHHRHEDGSRATRHKCCV